jgi:hypothetical protein
VAATAILLLLYLLGWSALVTFVFFGPSIPFLLLLTGRLSPLWFYLLFLN